MAEISVEPSDKETQEIAYEATKNTTIERVPNQ